MAFLFFQWQTSISSTCPNVGAVRQELTNTYVKVAVAIFPEQAAQADASLVIQLKKGVMRRLTGGLT